MIEPIIPAALAVKDAPGDFVTNTAVESARRTAARLVSASTLLEGWVRAGKLRIAAALYDLDNGSVAFIS
jgi:carbonic anhydrase